MENIQVAERYFKISDNEKTMKLSFFNLICKIKCVGFKLLHKALIMELMMSKFDAQT